MDINTALVSVCIPAYNSAHYIEETLHSLLDQTYRHIELIVVDDGSTDNTEEVVCAFKDKRLRYIKQQNKGAAAARNTAFNLSSGKYIKFMDADDLVNGVHIESQVTALSGNPECIASAKWGRFFGDDISTFSFTPEKVWKNMPGIDWLVQSLIKNGSNMTQPGIFLLPRKLIETVGLWDESLSLIDDFEFMTRMIIHSKQVLFCKDAVLMYRSGLQSSLSRSNSPQHMQSVLKAQLLGIHEILNVRNDSESRLACANSLQVWAFCFYQGHQPLYKQAQVEIKRLGGSDLKIKGGRLFVLLAAIIGWRKALDLKHFILKTTGKKDFNSFR